MKKKIFAAAAAAALFAFSQAAFAAQEAPIGLAYDGNTSGPFPIPAMERGLQTVTAQRWLKVSDEQHELEGAAFDKNGILYFCDVTARKVMRVTADKKLETFVEVKDYAPGGLAFGPDGRLYIAALDMPSNKGIIASVAPDGTDFKYALAPEAGFMPNDLIFDKEGGYYFSDFKGSADDPAGAVYYVSPGGKKITPVMKNIPQANGVALSPDGTVLWATEFGRGLLHRAMLEGPGEVWTLGRSVPYRFMGPSPDSMRADSDGNVYVAMYWQGRVMAFNANGIAVGQVLLEGRGAAQIASTSLAIDPKTKDMYIVGRTIKEGEGAWIYRAGAFAPGIAAK